MSALADDGRDDDRRDGADDCHHGRESRPAPAPAGEALPLPPQPPPLEIRMFGQAHQRASP